MKRITAAVLVAAPALVAAITLGAAAPAHAGDSAPAWLVALCKAPISEGTDRAPAVELQRECRITVNGSGGFRATTRGAIRILTREGRESAIAREFYDSGAGSVQELQAWMIRASGDPIAYGKKEAVDASMAGSEVHSEQRVRAIVATNDAEVGSVFGYESVVEYRQDFLQLLWPCQDALPVSVSKLVVTLPSDWRASTVTLHHAPIEPTREGDAWVWTAENLPYLESENWSPPLTSRAARLAVTLVPPAADSKWATTRFEDWPSVARYIDALAASQTTTTPALTAKARALVEGQSGEWRRIESVARYVQGLQYVSIQTGLARGGGYRPQAASDVFAKSYGDCKGKANLLRTMLREVGVQAHLVQIRADDPDFVREEWPSPFQFNHCVAAIEVGDAVQSPAVFTAGSRRYLMFDPTDATTPFGQIPFEEQGSLALLVAGSASTLVRVPASKPTDHGMERTIEGRVEGDGTLGARVVQRAMGREASQRRGEYRGMSAAAYRKTVEQRISESVPGAVITKLEVKDEFPENRFVLEVEFRAPKFARILPGGLLVVKPVNLEGSGWRPRRAERSSPLLLPSYHLSETTVVEIPQGYAAEECADPVRAQAPFGVFDASCALDGSKVRFGRTVQVSRALLTREEFGTASEFYDRVRSASQISVVLAPATPPAPASSR